MRKNVTLPFIGPQPHRSISMLLPLSMNKSAVDNLERLVVQQLFKMSKLGMSGVGMTDFFLQNDCILIILQGTSNMKSSVNL